MIDYKYNVYFQVEGREKNSGNIYIDIIKDLPWVSEVKSDTIIMVSIIDKHLNPGWDQVCFYVVKETVDAMYCYDMIVEFANSYSGRTAQCIEIFAQLPKFDGVRWVDNR